MTSAKRAVIRDLMNAILNVKHCPDDIRARAEHLLGKVDPFAALSRKIMGR